MRELNFAFTISPKTQNLVCARTGRVGQAQGATTNIIEATERTRSKHRAGIANECEQPMRGVCEV